MKNTKMFIGLLMFIAFSVAIVSCNKQELSLENPNLLSPEKISGVVPDDPARVALVPLIISEDFLEHQLDGLAGVNTFSGSLSTGRRDRSAPSVTFTSPANNSTVSSTTNISVNATDNVGVVSVAFSIDNVIMTTRTAAPYTYSWNTSGVSTGTHVIKATAKDAAGNTTNVSIQVGVNVAPTGDLAAPTITITSPTSGSSYNSGASVNVAVNATDNVGVASVSYTLDGAALSTSNVAPFGITLNTTSIAIGTHTITATAKDAAGNSASNSIMITVNTTVISTPPSTSTTYQLTMPPVGNQGSEGSCAVFAATYAARSTEMYYSTNATSYSYSSNIFSPEYIYNQIKLTDCNGGSSFITALDFMKNTGVCTWQTMPYSSSNGCSLMPTSSQNAEAATYKIANYARFYSTDSAAIKNALINKHPIIASLSIDQNFYNAGPGFIWRTSSGTIASHAIVLCGYDDSKHAYKIMNSWGTGWGDAGFTWIDYDLFPSVAFFYSYVIQ